MQTNHSPGVPKSVVFKHRCRDEKLSSGITDPALLKDVDLDEFMQEYLRLNTERSLEGSVVIVTNGPNEAARVWARGAMISVQLALAIGLNFV